MTVVPEVAKVANVNEVDNCLGCFDYFFLGAVK